VWEGTPADVVANIIEGKETLHESHVMAGELMDLPHRGRVQLYRLGGSNLEQNGGRGLAGIVEDQGHVDI
jgi:hypothetical protein